MIDLAIIGSGPASLTASIYAARLGLSVSVFEKSVYGGALNEISHLANFPGYDGSGADFAKKLKDQALSFGVELRFGECTSLDPFKIDDEIVEAKTILIATGTEPRKLDFAVNAPVSYCALCDAPLYSGKNILVVGGGNSAVGESIHLANIVKSLTLVSHSPLKADDVFIKKLASKKNVTILENYSLTKNFADQFDGVFVYIGKKPSTAFVPDFLKDKDGYIITKNYQTKIPNIFACGDARANSMKQALTASADGAAAAVAIADHLK